MKSEPAFFAAITAGLSAFVDARRLPMSLGTKHSPMFCTQNIRQYAEPRIFSSIIFGTLGHRAAGTSANEMPSNTIVE